MSISTLLQTRRTPGWHGCLHICLAVLLLALPPALRAQTGNVDVNFLTTNANAVVYSAAVQADGKILIGGDFTTVGTSNRTRIARLNANGTVEGTSTFNVGTGADGTVGCIAVQADGKIILGGSFVTVAGVTRNRIARLNSNGTLDATFNPNAANTVNSIAVQPDGKIVIGGFFVTVGGVARNRIARLNADGTLDTTFNPNANADVYGIALQGDGKILLGGNFTTVGGTTRNNLARLNTDGSLDAGFNTNLNGIAYSVAVQPDGKILVGGAFTTVGPTTRNRFARLNANGSLDTGFDPNVNGNVLSLAVQTDGKILFGGAFTTVGVSNRNRIARLNSDGTLDTNFNPNASSTVQGAAVQADGLILLGGNFTSVGGLNRTNVARLQNDAATQSLTATSANRIEWLRGGASPEVASVSFDFSTDSGVNWIALGAGVRISGGWEITGLTLPPSGIVRARAPTAGGVYSGSSGMMETTAAFSGFAASAPLVTTGSATNVRDFTATLTASVNPAGLATTARFEYGLTTSYGTATNITLSPTNGATLQSVSAALAGLTPGTLYHYRAVATNSAGETAGADLTFTTLLLPQIVVEQPSGTNLVDGITTNLFPLTLVGTTNSPRTFLIRNVGQANLTGLVITKDGVHSNDFTLNTNSMSTTLAPGGSTTFTIAFGATAFGSRTAAIHIANNDLDENPFDLALLGSGYRPGDVETNLIIGTGNSVYSVAVQADGKILLGGPFVTFGAVTRNNLARLNPDGSLDTGFNPNPLSEVDSLVVQPDGKIVVGGLFSTITSVTRNRIARVNADGSLDAGFNPNITGTAVYAMAFQPDGKILVGGDFTAVGGTARNRLARLNADGSLDTGFNPNANNTVRSISVQADGKIVVGGLFTAMGASSRTNVARLNADGTVDSGFSTVANNSVYCTAVQTDGKILIGGFFTTVNGTARTSFARLNADGTLDSGYNPAPNSTVYGLSLQANGKLIVSGNYTTIASTARNRIARLNADGTLDTTFNPDAGGVVYGAAIQADGMVILGGNFSTVGGLARTNLARLFNDPATQSLSVPSPSRIEWLRGGASPEAANVAFDFSTDGGANWIPLGSGVRISGGWEFTTLTLPASGQVRGRAQLPSGTHDGSSGLSETNAAFSGFTTSAPLVSTGGASNITDVLAALYASINPAGAATTARFEYGTTTSYGLVAAITLSPTNGATTQTVSTALGGLTPGTTYHYRVAASNSVGTTFGSDATFETLLYPDIAVEQPAGTNLVDGVTTNNFGLNLLGTSNAPRAFIIRNVGLTNLTGLVITKDGVHSNDFIVDTTGMSTALAPGASTTFNVIFATGATGTRTAAIHIANNDPDENPFDLALTGFGYVPGDVETNFNPSATGGSGVFGLAIQPDGKIIAGGDFTAISSPARSMLARLNLDGTVDPPFTNANGAVQCALVQPDGKVVIGGDFTTVAGVSRTRIARLNTNGTLDMSFSNNVNSTINGLALQPDGKILIAGQFTTVGGLSRPSMTRLNADGSLDSSFAATTANQNVSCLALLPDGKIMIGGFFWTVGGVSRTNLARLNSNGTLDVAYTNRPNATVYSLAVQPDGKVIMGGSFTAVNGVTRNRFARFNADDTLDSLDLNANNDVYGIALQTDGKIVVGGSFFNVKGSTTRNNIARLNADGTLDSFNPNSGSTVYGLAIQPDGKILVGGGFTTMNGTVTRNRIARLLNDGATQSLTAPAANRIEWLRGGASPETLGVAFDLSTDGGVNWTALGDGVRISGGWELTGLALPASGQVRGRARMSGGRNNGSSSLLETAAPFSGFVSSAPLVTTTAATNVIDVSATLTAIINPAGSATTARFEYGLTTSYGSVTNITLSPATGATTQNVSAVISGLTPGALYHFRAVATNSAGETAGGDLTFTTLLLPEIAVAQPAGTNLVDGVSTNNFGTNLMAVAGAPRTFVISNLGAADLVISAITKDGTHAADFTVDTNGMNLVIAPGAGTSFTVTFTPGTNTARTAAIHILNNDLDESSFDIALAGTGYKGGDLDLAFNPNASDFVRATAVQVDGKIVVLGIFTQMGGTARTNVARLNADGTLDAGFNPRPDSSVDAVTLESNRKILLGGFFTNISGQVRTRLARLNLDGSADSALNSGANSSVYSIVPQPDGKLILCGNFTNVAGQARNRIARLNTDGSVDAGFNPNADSSVSGALLQTNGQIIVWGNFDNIGGSARHRIARLNTNGTVESVFNPNPDISVYCATLQADSRILVGGDFTAIGGLARNRLARLNTDGTADPGFNPNANEYVISIAQQADGKIVVGGNFTQMGGVARLYLARVNANGTLDGSFNPNPLNILSSVALQTDGRILVAGSFTTIGGVARNRIARLLNENATESLTVPSASRIEWLRGGTVPEAMAVSFDVSIDGGTAWIPLGAGTRINGGWERTGLNLPASGQVRGQALVTGGSGNAAVWVAETVTNFSGLPAPEIAVEQPAGATVADGGSRDFGAVLLGGSSNLTFTITNSGNADLAGLIVTKDGAHGADFTVNTNGLGATLAAGASATFTVTFTPGALGARSAALHIANNDIDESPYDITLTGAGVAPEIVVEQPAGTGLTNGAAAINFGSLVPGASSVAKTFIISNSGSSTLNGLAVTVDGANPGDFAVNDSGVPASLIPGGSATFSVTFTPPLAGSRSATLHIASDDADENPFDIALTGTGANQSPVRANPIPDRNATATLPFTYTFPINTFTDPDSAQSLTYTAFRDTGAALPAWLTFAAGTRTFSGTPAPADAGTLGVRVIATDNGTPSLSATDTFDIVIAPIAPSVSTAAATSVGSYGATLQAVINPNGLPTAAQFEYGTTPSYGLFATITLVPNNGTTAQNVSATIASLTPNTTYHFRAVATNSADGNAGADLTFVTDPPPPGLVDSDFNPSSVFGVLTIALQPDGKILAGGDYAQINGRPYVPRLNPDGTSDLSWNPFNFSKSFALMVLPDGKVLAGGSQANAQTGINLVRMNPNGALDTSLNELAFNDYVFAMALQADGKLVVGGAFTTAFGQSRVSLARINADATLDTTFTNLNLNGHVLSMVGLPDGKVIVGGGFTQIGGQTRNFIARLNTDGSVDNTFVGSAPAGVVTLALQADGKILYVSLQPAAGAWRLTRLNADGSVDSSFAPTNDNLIHTVAVQTDGKILIGGTFTQVNGTPRSRFARLNQNGSLDPLFNPGPNSEVSAVMLQADGKILVGGPFTNISGEAHQRLARLNNDAATQSLTVPLPNRVQWLRGGASPEAVSVSFEFTADSGLTWTPLGQGTRISGGWEKTGFTLPPSGLVRARAVVAGGYRGNCSSLLEATAAFSGFPPTPPFVTTLPATSVDENSVTLHASINPGGSGTAAQFEYGTNASYGSIAPITLVPDNGGAPQQVSVAVNGLRPATLYYFRVTATNGVGGVAGSTYTFTTLGFPEISVEQPAGTTLTDGGTVAFGTNLVGAPLIKTFTITNLGTTNLAPLSISKNGANAAEFVVSTLTNLIPPGGSATFDVTFNPATPGAKTAAIHITSNDTDESPFDISLTGTAISPEITVEFPPGVSLLSNLVGYNDEVFCAPTLFGGTTLQTVTVRNSGSANLILSGITLIGAQADQFAVGSLTSSNLPPGTTATFVVTFHPTTPGEKIAAFQISNNDADENPFQLQVRGSGLTPDIVVEQPSGTGLVNGVNTIDYGGTFVGTPVVKTFFIRNSGNYDLTGLVVTKDGTNAADFIVSALDSQSVYPGVYTFFNVTFNPLTAGAKTAAIHIASSDPDESPFDIALTGVSTGLPEIAVQQPAGADRADGGTVAWGNLQAGTALLKTFVVTNPGTADLTNLSVAMDGADAAEFTLGALATNALAPGGSVTFDVTFHPATTGAKTAAIHIASNDADENPFDLTLTGGGTAPEIVVEHPAGTDLADGAATFDFGTALIGALRPAKTFTIRNTGTTNLTGLAVSVDGAAGGDFTINTAAMSNTLPAGASTAFSVTFSPGASGSRAAALHIVSSDADESPFDIALTGEGVTPLAIAQQAYLKASTVGQPDALGINDHFGFSVAVSGDIVVVGAVFEDGNGTGSNPPPNENATDSGAAYVFVRSGTTWVLEAYLKASNPGAYDNFGWSVAVSGNTIVVGAPYEGGGGGGVNPPSNEGSYSSGAAYVFVRNGTNWSQQAYLKMPNPTPFDLFGWSVSVSGDTIVVGSGDEDGGGSGVNPPSDEGSTDSGAAFVFVRTGTNWSQQAYLKASNNGAGDYFGKAVAVSGDTIVVGSRYEDGGGTGVNPAADESSAESGAAYIFVRTGTNWSQQAYLKASNAGSIDVFGWSVAISGDTVVVGAYGEDGSGTGVNPPSDDLGGDATGAAYVFTRTGTNWTQQAYLKAPNPGAFDDFGFSVAVSGDTVVIGAHYEAGSGTGINPPENNTAYGAGAAYIYTRSGTNWSHRSYVKSFNNGAGDAFGYAVAVSGDTIVAGAVGESGNGTGVNPPVNELAPATGAAYVFATPAPEIAVQQPLNTNVADGGSRSFGSLIVGTNSSLTFLVTNSGVANLTGLGITIDGAAAGDFAVTVGPVAPVTPNASTTFTVTFTPTAAGARTAALHLASNDTDENPFNITLTGTGLAVVSSGSVTNGSLAITNIPGSGAMNLTIRRVTVGGTNYLEVSDASNSIAAGAGATQVNANTIRVPEASVTNQLQITGGASDDHFVIDATGGCPLPPGGVNIDGGGQTLNGADTLQVIGTFSSVTYDANNPGAGVVTTGCGNVNFTGLEPVDFTSAALGSLAINVNPANLFPSPVTTTLSVMPGAGHEAHTRVAFSGGLELIDFGALTNTLTITGDPGATDSIIVQNVGTSFAGHLVITAQAGDAVFLTNTTLTLGAGKNFSIAAANVTLGSATVTAGGTVSFNGGAIAMRLDGPANNQHSRLAVIGAVALSNSPALNLTGSYMPQPGDSFTLIDNDGSDPIAGTFAGLPQGATITFNGVPMGVSYTGGSGNDLVLTVNPGNTPPHFTGSLANFTVNPGAVISFAAAATDADLGDVLSFSLVNPPAFAAINSGGAFSWRTHLAQAGTTNTVKIVVTDNGTPNLTATNSFTVIVNPLVPVTLTPVGYAGGNFTFAVNGATGPDYVISTSTNLVDWVDIHTNLAPALPFQFNDPSAGAGGFKTYRVRLQP